MGTGKHHRKKFSGDVADAGPWPSGPTAPTAQSCGQPTDWIFYLPPLSLSVNTHISLISTLVSLSDWCKEKMKKNKQRRKKKRGRKRRRRKERRREKEKKIQSAAGTRTIIERRERKQKDKKK
jgi:hypothetical protein